VVIGFDYFPQFTSFDTVCHRIIRYLVETLFTVVYLEGQILFGHIFIHNFHAWIIGGPFVGFPVTKAYKTRQKPTGGK
jgi:hypothetical protein